MYSIIKIPAISFRRKKFVPFCFHVPPTLKSVKCQRTDLYAGDRCLCGNFLISGAWVKREGASKSFTLPAVSGGSSWEAGHTLSRLRGGSTDDNVDKDGTTTKCHL